jgi:hypothetical protein
MRIRFFSLPFGGRELQEIRLFISPLICEVNAVCKRRNSQTFIGGGMVNCVGGRRSQPGDIAAAGNQSYVNEGLGDRL